MAESVSYWICSCGKSNLNSHKQCSACSKSRPRSWRFYALAILVLTILLGVLLPKSEDVDSHGANLPEAQETFLAAIRQAKADILVSPNSLAASQALLMRDADLSRWATVSRWRGRVLGVQQMQGKGAVSVDIGGVELVAGVYLSLGLDTLVSPSDQSIFGQLSGLQAGDIVDVSGRFVIHDGALVDLSYTGSGSVDSPRFLFEFSEVAPVTE